MNTDLERNNGFATPDDLAVVRTLDVLGLSHGEFKDVIDARNGHLTLPALERLRAAAQRQSDAQGDDGRRRIFFVDDSQPLPKATVSE